MLHYTYGIQATSMVAITNLDKCLIPFHRSSIGSKTRRHETQLQSTFYTCKCEFKITFKIGVSHPVSCRSLMYSLGRERW